MFVAAKETPEEAPGGASDDVTDAASSCEPFAHEEHVRRSFAGGEIYLQELRRLGVQWSPPQLNDESLDAALDEVCDELDRLAT